uniref:HMG box domain-containing protein n=1 Tax=viral metagenome TaxID=1070528 RepID=A0A6C0CXU1_9ZZZZ
MTKINKYVCEFLEENSELLAKWNSKDNQKKFNNVVKGKETKKKNENAPKSCKSAYIFFCNENREKIKNSDPSISSKNVMTELGSLWNKLKDTNQKEVDRFTKLAEQDKQRYKKEMDSYVPEDSEQNSNKSKKDGPKRSKSAYMFFCEDERSKVTQANPSFSAKEVVSELGKRWNNVKGTNLVEKYDKLALADKERYNSEKGVTKSDKLEIVEEVSKPVNPIKNEKSKKSEKNETPKTPASAKSEKTKKNK